MDSITVKRNPSSENELANKKYVDDSLGGGSMLKIIQTPDDYLKVSVGKDIYNLTNNEKKQIADKTLIKTGNGVGLMANYF